MNLRKVWSLSLVANRKRNWIGKIFFIVWFFFLLLLCVKTYNNSNNMRVWQADESRDYLVAMHIVKFHEWRYVVPITSFNFFIANSVFYYYFLAVLYFFSRSVVTYNLLYLLLYVSLTILFSYKYGKLNINKGLGYVLPFFFLLNPQWFRMSLNPFQPFFVSLLILISVFFLLLSYANKKKRFLLLSTFIFGLTWHFHFSSIIVTPFYILLVMYLNTLFRQQDTGEHSKRPFSIRTLIKSQFTTSTYILLVFGILLLINNVVVSIIMYKNIDPSIFLSNISQRRDMFSVFIDKNFSLFFANLYNKENILDPILTTISMVVIVLALLKVSYFLFFEKTGWRRMLRGQLSVTEEKYFYFLVCLFLFSSFFLFYVINLPEIFDYYFAPFYPLFLLLVFFAIAVLDPKIQWLFSMVILTVLLLNKWVFLTSHDKSVENQLISQSAMAITTDLKSSNISSDDFSILVLGVGSYWDNTIYWPYIEEDLNESMVNLKNGGNNILPKNKRIHYLYIICTNQYFYLHPGKTCNQSFTDTNEGFSYQQIFFIKDRVDINRLYFTSSIGVEDFQAAGY